MWTHPSLTRPGDGVGGSALAPSLSRLTDRKPASTCPTSRHGTELSRAARIVATSERADAALALLGDKSFLFGDRGFVMYRRVRGFLVALGDPVGPEEQAGSLVRDFGELARQEGRRPVFYRVGPTGLDDHRTLGLRSAKVGEEARVDLPDFTMEGSRRRRLRQTVRRTERGGGSFEVMETDAVGGILDELGRVSGAWLESKNAREKGFSLGSFEPRYVSRFPVATVRSRGRLVAFANLWCGAPGGELAVDLMRYTPDAPYGVMEYLFVRLFEWGRDRGFSAFNLGMAPLAGLSREQGRCAWERAGAALFRHGEYFYNFRGVRDFKDKFQPSWSPRFLSAPGGLTFGMALAAVRALVAGGVAGILSR